MLTAAILTPSNLVRATGLVVLVLISASMVFGLLARSRKQPKTERSLTTASKAAIHRNLTLLALAVLAAHVIFAIEMKGLGLRWFDAFIPFVSSFRRIWIGFGVLALDLFVLATLTSLVRHRLSWRTWRVVHLLTYLAWPVAVLHSLDVNDLQPSLPALRLVGYGCVAAVLVAAAWFLSARRSDANVTRISGFVAMSALALFAIIWNARPAGGLPSPKATSATVALSPLSLPARLTWVPASGTLTLVRRSAKAPSEVDLQLRTTSGSVLHVAFPADQPAAGLRQSVATFGPANAPFDDEGKVSAIRSGELEATVSPTAGGAPSEVVVKLRSLHQDGNVTGLVATFPATTTGTATEAS